MYDPLLEKALLPYQKPSSSYWQSTDTIPTYPELKENLDVDVAIVGGGYTGLSCALNLLKQGITNICLVDANNIGWGCSSRNAGFVLPGSGRLSYADLVNKFGKKNALSLHEDFLMGINNVSELALRHDIDKTEKGYLKLAHSKTWFNKLIHSAQYLSKEFNYEVDTLSQQTLHNEFVIHNKAYGAVRYKNGFGINPLKLVNAYLSEIQKLSGQLYSNTSVISISNKNGLHQLQTSNGNIRAKKIVLATNGYTPKNLTPRLQGKILPVLTSVIVTRPLTEQELQESGFNSKQVMMDTRELKYYYRLLPDNRILFGGRGGITGEDANNPIYSERLLSELKQSFVGLNSVSIAYKWSGWISVSFDQMPHIYGTTDHVYYATGFCGSGVSFTSLAGKQLADLVAEKVISTPLYSELPSFPFSPFRRFGQRMFYQYGRIKDRLT